MRKAVPPPHVPLPHTVRLRVDTVYHTTNKSVMCRSTNVAVQLTFVFHHVDSQLLLLPACPRLLRMGRDNHPGRVACY